MRSNQEIEEKVSDHNIIEDQEVDTPNASRTGGFVEVVKFNVDGKWGLSRFHEKRGRARHHLR
jgi:hypothetical protein